MEPNVAPPAQAIRVGEWDDIAGGFRVFDGPKWRIKHTTDRGRGTETVISVVGLQHANGNTLREIIIDCPGTPIVTPAEARDLARAINAAADSAEA
ncbi:hypothetical protein [Mycobacterium sp. 94-17]|uniref:hypothetical protein n=1 Tax=Mycobacterium sp. 94-17 TaxID=2986147 RepID=UPI002D1EB4FE|nr:hypothetical protein [Mycobacterium sp. 94-17]MEB4207995.1 hypothetical protein [Mycobacterium sp. 94-17]